MTSNIDSREIDMTIVKLIYQLLFGPLELFFETVYGIAYNIVGSTGAAIIPLSLCVNFLLLPLYNSADAMQREESEHEKQMAEGVAHIKKTFKGDERYMMLQAYYRVNHHKPVYALRSSLAILLEIPFFVAAYHFLATYPGLNGAVFGPLKNLAAPDRLLQIGSLPINVLPILMTAINIVSASIYAKDMTRKDKIKLYAMALVFLAVLYFSPSGLVFYWTLNNLFSLVKNVVNSLKGGTRKKVICAVFTAIGAVFIGYALLVYKKHDLNQLLVIVIGLVFIIPMIRAIAGAKIKREKPEETEGPKKKISLFVIACLFMTILLGVLIPSSVIKSSPAEFVVITEYQSPLLYVISALCLAAGTFMLWFNLFYYLANNKAKRVMEACIWIVAVVAVVNYMFFGTKLGNLSAELKYDIDLSFTARQCLINAAVIALAGAAVFMLWLKKRKIVAAILPVIVVAVAGMSIYNIAGISTRLPGLKTLVEQQSTEKTNLTLSKTGKNVIVLMLDRSIGVYVPYIMQEDTALKEQFDGFTYYPNTLSYGTRTNTGSPALFGGYEYTPEEMNKRDTEKLADKQNEALKVMPVIFSEAGYDVTVCDPPYAGYTWIPDLS
ncbi:MAG: membrane protein insertase YidC, partial [Synergistes sp.]|nr:membrane protein insertase YidC [Synergistes sp.]